MAERPKSLTWVGPMTLDGNPAQWMPGIPARDLKERDLKRMSDELVAEALASGFYKEPGAAKTAAKPAAATVAAEPAGEG